LHNDNHKHKTSQNVVKNLEIKVLKAVQFCGL